MQYIFRWYMENNLGWWICLAGYSRPEGSVTGHHWMFSRAVIWILSHVFSLLINLITSFVLSLWHINILVFIQKYVISISRHKRHLSLTTFSHNCYAKTTSQGYLDSRGCIIHQLPDRLRSSSLRDIFSLIPQLSREPLMSIGFLLVQMLWSIKVKNPVLGVNPVKCRCTLLV